MELERILGSDTGKKAFYKSDENFQAIQTDVNANAEAIAKNEEQYGTIQTQTILENYLSAHNIPSTAKRGKLDVALSGMTLVNLLGAAGNCEDLNLWGGKGTLDTSTKVFGNASIKNGSNWNVARKVNCIAGNKYFFSAYLKTDSTTGGYGRATVFSYSLEATSNTFTRKGIKMSPTQAQVDANSLLYLLRSGGTDGDAWADGVMVMQITDEEYSTLSVEELMSKYPYYDGLQGSSNTTVLSTGKNIANPDINKTYRREGQTSPNISLKDSTFTISGATAAGRFIAFNYRVAKGRQYTVSFNKNNADIGFKAHSTKPSYWNGYGISLATGTVITASEEWLQIYFEVAEGQIGTVSNFQLEEGTVVTAYEPYKSTQKHYKTLDGQVITLHRLLNGTYDEILRDGRNVKRIGEKTLVSSDIVNIISGTNVQLVQFKKPSDFKYFGVTSGSVNDKCFLYPPYETYNFDDYDNINNLNKVSHRTSAGNMSLAIPLATYPNLAAAQTALAGTKFVYELAQPQILETNAVPLIAEPNGHVFISADSCMPSNEISYPLNLGAVVDGLLNGQKEHSKLLDNRGLQIDNLPNLYMKFGKEIPNKDYNQAVDAGWYIGSGDGTVNAPEVNFQYGMLLVQKRLNTLYQIAFYRGNIKSRYYDGSTWTTWLKFLTDEPTSWITASLQNAWTGTLQYRKNQIGQIEIKFDLTAGTITASTNVTNLPVDYRPSNLYSIIFGYKTANGTGIPIFWASNSGNIAMNASSGVSTGDRIVGSAVLC